MNPTKQNTMEAIYLQSSLQFGETLKSVSDSDYRRLRDNYDALLKQPLKLGFFVPCDSIGRLVESIGAEEWDNAKKNVLFKGFEHYLFRQADNIKHNKSSKCFSFPNYNGVIIEDLISLEVELTESAIKQIGL